MNIDITEFLNARLKGSSNIDNITSQLRQKRPDITRVPNNDIGWCAKFYLPHNYFLSLSYMSSGDRYVELALFKGDKICYGAPGYHNDVWVINNTPDAVIKEFDRLSYNILKENGAASETDDE